ncbi:hypothetical protein K439DRAFT_1610232 [Ramaria rubella]|nr:hypothetical protein K439DRAFT_1610232 [Ramaria rubella]
MAEQITHFPYCKDLSFRSPNYKPDMADYVAYTAARDDFFWLHRACAALLRGGIIWCLAIEALAALDVLEGPSLWGLIPGRWWEDSSGALFYDDDISTTEMNLVCGVYRVYTGSGQQAADVSWWPKQSMWNSGGWLLVS